MSIFDGFRTTAKALFAKFGVPATITREVAATQSNADRAAGRAPAAALQTITGLGILGTTKVQLADGTLATRITATLDTKAMANDKLAIGAKTYTVDTCDEINPDGGEPISFKAMMR